MDRIDLEGKYNFVDRPIECGPGWDKILDELFFVIKKNIDTKVIDISFKIIQVKEKWGTLRVYTNWGDDHIWQLISQYEELTHRVCELCGEPGELRIKGWMSTLCNSCNEKRYKGEIK